MTKEEVRRKKEAVEAEHGADNTDEPEPLPVEFLQSLDASSLPPGRSYQIVNQSIILYFQASW